MEKSIADWPARHELPNIDQTPCETSQHNLPLRSLIRLGENQDHRAKRQELVIAGYTPSSKGLPGFDSLVLGVYEKGKLVYAGRVGAGFTLRQRSDWKKQLAKLSRQASPLALIPRRCDQRGHCVLPYAA